MHFCVHKPQRPLDIPVVQHPISKEQLEEWRKQHEAQYQKALAKATALNDTLGQLHAKYGPKLGELSTRLGRVVRAAVSAAKTTAEAARADVPPAKRKRYQAVFKAAEALRTQNANSRGARIAVVGRAAWEKYMVCVRLA
jgi:hypothetical protein